MGIGGKGEKLENRLSLEGITPRKWQKPLAGRGARLAPSALSPGSGSPRGLNQGRYASSTRRADSVSIFRSANAAELRTP
jgi:hypothetical protein